ncbi:hypothetical protein [Deinococcus frigens]|uniref:DUF7674 family protein n=1 Tax=Deinococcus frigens TaxID=249403 RepID=UPI00049769E0|nr:hypothetical protein [Deinococcus frigens]
MTTPLWEIRHLLLQAFPRIEDELEDSGSNYLDVATAARGAVAAATEDQDSELTALFACVERLFVEGDQEVRTLMGAGLIEGLQNHAVNQSGACEPPA